MDHSGMVSYAATVAHRAPQDDAFRGGAAALFDDMYRDIERHSSNESVRISRGGPPGLGSPKR